MIEPVSIFRTPEGKAKSMVAYDVLAHWPVLYEEPDMPTRFGDTHVIVSPAAGARPILILHGQDSCATS